VPNNGGGPGNPFARQVAELRRAALAATTPEKIAAVIGQLEAKALQGDVAAAKLYLSYTLGRPAATVDPDSVHVQEALLLQKEVGLLEMVTRSMMKPLLESLLTIVRTSRPEITEEFVQGLLAGFAAQDAAERAREEQATQTPSATHDGDDISQEVPAAPSPNGENGTPPEQPAEAWQPSGMDGLPVDRHQSNVPAPKGNGGNGGSGQRSREGSRGWVPPWEGGLGDRTRPADGGGSPSGFTRS
jgi:hypothetical protein